MIPMALYQIALSLLFHQIFPIVVYQVDPIKAIEVRKSTRKPGAPAPMRIEVSTAEIKDLEDRAMVEVSTKPKGRNRKRKKTKLSEYLDV